ncbi:hypothetical protein XENTR_v10009984 [Xenopus tropicalis]|uniref:Intercellular adhesion molecule 3 n=1 Tax=Xenopus tropicalis TaxID=8364 RepID=A0A8J0T220_XENTR|nr:intercellular adhesion molecule 3 [Xenopus tropicalis]KAE8619815.1 hypothetical protein XENTR_v10009984 [Xenopus tropicalis]|eukprot:XP_017948023.1 PREDICTED: intercellular adhesion molecule 3-like [Xenopus tropicalis]
MALGMPRLSLVTFCMFGIYCAGASEEPCYGNVGDREVYAPYGSWALLNCTHNCTKVDWETRLIQKNRTKGPGWVSVEVKVGGYDIWRASDISCTVLSGREAVDNYITVIPYEIPRLVTLDMEDMLEEGKSYNVTCTVHGVAPIQNLRVTMLRGKEEIYNKTFKDDSRVGNITEPVTYQITAERSDNMEDFSCQATLALGTAIGNVTVPSANVPVRTFGNNTCGREHTALIVLIVLIAAAAGIVAGKKVFLWKRKEKCASDKGTQENTPALPFNGKQAQEPVEDEEEY